MKKTTSIISIVILLAVATGIFVYSKYSKQSDVIKIEDKQTVYGVSPLNVKITYPQINGLDDFNKKVKDIIDKEFDSFKNNSLENDKAVRETDPVNYAKYPRQYDLDISYTLGQHDKDIISLVFNEYNFEGGAHGATIFIPFNYNVKTGQEIKLSEIFSSQPDYLKKISDFCIKDLTNQLTDSGGVEMTNASWIQRGAEPTEENYSIFLINKNNIVFYFPQYQVAAYAAGDFRVTYPR